MRLLHTSDWHLGRCLHGHDLLPAQVGFLDHLVEVATEERVDAVLVSGDVHDRALPPVDAVALFGETLARLRDADIAVVVISGNHDAPARLGDKAALLDRRVSLRTDPASVGEPVLLADGHGSVAVYALPYLEPGAVASSLAAVHADRARRGGRSVVLAHAWVTGGAASESERSISVGGVDRVPASLFDGFDYAALGHLHRPQALSDAVRYSGSPLAFSFSEADARKSCWLVELDASGLAGVEAVPAPVPRGLSVLRGSFEELLTGREHDGRTGDFVQAVVTDVRRPMDLMATVRRRFPHALDVRWEPPVVAGVESTYAARTQGRSDVAVAEAFLSWVRSDPDDAERGLLRAALEAATAAEAA